MYYKYVYIPILLDVGDQLICSGISYSILLFTIEHGMQQLLVLHYSQSVSYHKIVNIQRVCNSGTLFKIIFRL